MINLLLLLLVCSCCVGHSESGTYEVGDPCSPPAGHASVVCGESNLIDETVIELSMEDGYGVNTCLQKRTYESKTHSFSYKQHCTSSHHGHHNHCSLVCEREGDCTGTKVNTTKKQIGCCDGFGIDPVLVPTTSRRRGLTRTISHIARTNGCPIRLQESVLHSLLILNMPSFVLQLSSHDTGLLDLLWPRAIDNITETFTVFGIPEGEFEQLENVLPNSALSQAIPGHIVQGTIYGATLTHRTIITPIDGNFSIHVTTVATPSTKSIYLNGARINQTDASQARNGIVHVMESFIPLSDMTITEVLQSQSKRFSTFSKLLDEADVTEQLGLNSNSNSRTLLALANSAFEGLPSGAVDCLLQEEHQRYLREFVLIHVALPTEYSSTLSQRAYLRTYSRYSLIVTAEEDTIWLTRKRIKIEEADIPASNGVIHVIAEPILTFNITALCS